MTAAAGPQVSRTVEDPDKAATFGGWLFRQRTLIPLPLSAAVLLLPPRAAPSVALVAAGVAVTAGGEALRLWAVHHIGAISRTRTDRLGPLVSSGPFALIRNPLYVGNIALWAGFAITARLLWLAPVFVVLLAIEYHAIVRWEERLLESRIGEPYRDYMKRVPRWMPMFNRRDRGNRREDDIFVSSANAAVRRGSFSWGETLFSERGTLIAMGLGYALLWLKARF